MKKLIAKTIAIMLACFAFAETNTKKVISYDFSIVRKSTSVGESLFYDITYTPHKSITPIHVYILATSELSFTEDELATMFEYLSNDSYFYTKDEALAPLHLSKETFEVISLRSGGKDNHIFLRQKTQ